MNTEHIEIALAAIQIYGASHPRPSEVTQEQACELLGRSAPYVRKLIRSRKLATNGNGRIPITEIDRMLAAKAA